MGRHGPFTVRRKACSSVDGSTSARCTCLLLRGVTQSSGIAVVQTHLGATVTVALIPQSLQGHYQKRFLPVWRNLRQKLSNILANRVMRRLHIASSTSKVAILIWCCGASWLARLPRRIRACLPKQRLGVVIWTPRRTKRRMRTKMMSSENPPSRTMRAPPPQEGAVVRVERGGGVYSAAYCRLARSFFATRISSYYYYCPMARIPTQLEVQSGERLRSSHA